MTRENSEWEVWDLVSTTKTWVKNPWKNNILTKKLGGMKSLGNFNIVFCQVRGGGRVTMSIHQCHV